MCGTSDSSEQLPLSLPSVAGLTISRKDWFNMKKFSVFCKHSLTNQRKSRENVILFIYTYREIQVHSSLTLNLDNSLSNFSSTLPVLQEFCVNEHSSSVSWLQLNSGQRLHLELTFKFFTSTENSTINSQLSPGWGSAKHEWRFSYVNKIAVNSFNKTATVIEQQRAHIVPFTSSCTWLNWQGLGYIPPLFYQVFTCLVLFEAWQLFLMETYVKLMYSFI